MKLRIRHSETKETFRLDLPPSSSLADLQALVAARLGPAHDSAAVRLSLNRRDELAASSTAETLQSVGLASGDLLFYTLDPSGFSSSTPPAPLSQGAPPPPPGPAAEALIVGSTVPAGGGSGDRPPDRGDETLATGGNPQEEMAPMEGLEEEDLMSPPGEYVMEVDDGRASNSVPGFLKRILEAEKENESARSELGVLVIAIHAVLLESGFMAHNCEGNRMPDGWASKASTVSISYTIPEVTRPDFEAVVGTIELKILLVGKFVDVYGYLLGSSDLYRLCLDASKYVPFVLSSMDVMSEEGEKIVFELWKTVKDRLSLPLLIDLCEKNGIPPPPCFICLPTELKIRILEFCSGTDLARIACANSELRYLSSNDDLWKQKFLEEFPGREMSGRRGDPGRRWKDKFAACSEDKKRNKRHRVVSSIYQFGAPPLLRRDPSPFGIPMPLVIGGDYDRFPAIGLAGPSGHFANPHLLGSRRRKDGLGGILS
ncbi:hypothetical protein Taro_033009 [Colocasia esculenta]|uniref:F-box domain-containing protein n=1 Tax=Colocasia esculenta TaxID=4460 RepID=A0A843W0J3_COLES|nr:hypothetical protein [Colocasia esculenta]